MLEGVMNKLGISALVSRRRQRQRVVPHPNVGVHQSEER